MQRWESVGNFLDRIAVPGGWLYRAWAPAGGTFQLAFVPELAQVEHRSKGPSMGVQVNGATVDDSSLCVVGPTR